MSSLYGPPVVEELLPLSAPAPTSGNGAPPEAPTVELALEYEPTPPGPPPITEAKLGAIPVWLLLVGGLFWALNRYYAE